MQHKRVTRFVGRSSNRLRICVQHYLSVCRTAENQAESEHAIVGTLLLRVSSEFYAHQHARIKWKNEEIMSNIRGGGGGLTTIAILADAADLASRPRSRSPPWRPVRVSSSSSSSYDRWRCGTPSSLYCFKDDPLTLSLSLLFLSCTDAAYLLPPSHSGRIVASRIKPP